MRQLHAQEESASCDDCGKVFVDKTKLQKHSAVHKGNGVICKLCMNCYKSQACLKAHVRGKHEKAGKKVCLICFQIMADEKELKVEIVYYTASQITYYNILIALKLNTFNNSYIENTYIINGP